MSETFQLKKGTLPFEADRLLIADGFPGEKRMALLRSGIWTIFGTLSVFRYFQTGDLFLLWTGVLIGIAHLTIFTVLLFRSTRTEIPFAEIRAMTLRHRFGNHFMDIRLNNDTTRRVNGLENLPELQRMIASMDNED